MGKQKQKPSTSKKKNSTWLYSVLGVLMLAGGTLGVLYAMEILPVKQTIIIVSTVVNNSGAGNLVEADFSAKVIGAGVELVSFTSSQAGTEIRLQPGNYRVESSEAPGYKASMSQECSGSIALGETRYCTITHTRQTQVVVDTVVINDDNRNATASDFRVKVVGSGAKPVSFVGSSAPTMVILDPGEYRIAPHEDWQLYEASMTAECSGSIALNETKRCTITFNDIAQPSYTVEEPERSCYDSDGGINYDVRGKLEMGNVIGGVRRNSFGANDHCHNDKILIEYLCPTGTENPSRRYTCPFGCDRNTGTCKSGPDEEQ